MEGIRFWTLFINICRYHVSTDYATEYEVVGLCPLSADSVDPDSVGIVGMNRCYEVGRSSELLHSFSPGALMYPNYASREPRTHSLSHDNNSGIQAVYGPSGCPIQPTGPTGLSSEAIATLGGEIVFFKDKYFWRWHPQLQRVEPNFIYPSLPSGIQALTRIWIGTTVSYLKAPTLGSE